MLKKTKTSYCLDNGVLVLIGGFSLHLVLGAMYLWGAISVYITSYLRLRNTDFTIDHMFFILPLLITFTSVFSSVGPYLLKFIKPKL